MSWIQGFVGSSIGSKAVAAVTGLLLLAFVVGHLAGNLLVFGGQDGLNDYAAFLESKPGLLWAARIGLVVVLVSHIYTVTRLQLMNRAARPQDYSFKATVQASLASRTMMVSGALILLYVVYHLLHFTFGITDPQAYDMVQEHAGGSRHDVYGMVVSGFANSWLVTGVYVAANAMLAWHLSHGISSLCQTLGLNDERYNAILRNGGTLVAAIIGAGYISIPLGIRFGLVG